MQVTRTLSRPASTSGCTAWQLLWRVRMPLALPQILLGINQTIMLALSMLVITALVGTRDLGQEVYIALAKADIGRGLVAGLCVAFIAITADRLIAAATGRGCAGGWARPEHGRAHQGRRRSRSGAGRWSRSRWAAASPTPTSWSDDGRGAASCASATTSPSTTSCAGTSWRRAAPPMPPASRRPCSMPSRACSSSTWSRAAPSAPEDIRERRNLERIVPLLRRVHRELPRFLRGPALAFWVFHVLRDYAAGLAEARSSPRRRAARPARSRRAPGAGSGAGRAGLRPQRPARRQPDRRRRAPLAGRLGLWRLGTARCSTSAASRRTASCRRREREWLLEAYFERPLDDELRQRARCHAHRLAAARGDVEHGVRGSLRRSTSTSSPTPPRTWPASSGRGPTFADMERA